MFQYLKTFALTIALMVIVILAGFVLAGTDLTAPSDTPTPTMYTLEDIYNLIHDNTILESSDHALSPESGVSPTTESSYSVSQLYADLANLVKRENLETGVVYLGVTGDYGNPDPDYATTTVISSSVTPTVSAGEAWGYSLEDIWNLIENNATTTPHSHSATPDGTPSSSMYTLTQIYEALVALGIEKAPSVNPDFTYLGVVGSYVPSLPFSATGGVITYTDLDGLNPRSDLPYEGGYTIHTFTDVGEDVFSVTGDGEVEVLIVAGGGAGGTDCGGGGGAGGLIYDESYLVSFQDYSVTVGSGGLGGSAGNIPTNGDDSVFDNLIAVGGGAGSYYSGNAAQDGGSGGGGGECFGFSAAGFGVEGQGNDGGYSEDPIGDINPAGGGGAGGPGSSTNNQGGAGLYFSQFSVVGGSPAGYFASGGSALPAERVDGGGGRSQESFFNSVDIDAVENTGGGGGGAKGGAPGGIGGAGGSGIVIIRYLTP